MIGMSGMLGIKYVAIAIALSLVGCNTTYEHEESPYQNSKCPASVEPTPGELGVLSFAHDRGDLICLFGCGAREPLAARSKSRLVVYSASKSEIPPVTVESSDPAVASFDITKSGRIAVTSGNPGTARLEIKDASGTLIDALPVVVKNVSSIHTEYDDGMAIMIGGGTSVNVDLKDENDCPMLGLGGVDYALSGGIAQGQVTLAELLLDFVFQQFISSADESFTLTADALGAGTIQISAPGGASSTVPVEVVDASGVATVTVHADGDFTPGDSHEATAQAFTADERRVLSPKCEWALSPATGPLSIKSTTRDSAYVYSDVVAEAELSCTIGATSGSTTIQFAAPGK
jgi:hypothetical protein